MKLNILKNTTTGAGSLKKIKFTIDSENMGMVYQSFLNYSNPVGSIVREITSNAYDSHIEAGIDESIQIEIKDANFVTDEPGQLIITDFGVGLSPQRVEDIYSKFFSSTKRDTNDEIGGFGIGAKSPLSYADIFTVVTNYENVEYTYLVSRGELSPEIELFGEESTDKSNGTSVIIPINDGDIYKVRTEIKNQLKYFDNVKYINCGIESDYKVVRSNKGFIFNTDYLSKTDGQTDICIGQVRYPIDYTAINKGNWQYRIPIAIHFDIGELPVVWNREAITYTKEAIDLIGNRLESVYDYLKEMAKEQGNYTDLDQFFSDLSANKLGGSTSTVRLGAYIIPIPQFSFRVSCAVPTAADGGGNVYINPSIWAKRWEHHGYIVNGKVRAGTRHKYNALTYYKFKEETLAPTTNKFLNYKHSKTIQIMIPATLEHNHELLINNIQGFSNLYHEDRAESQRIGALVFDTMFKYMEQEYDYYGDVKPTKEFFDHLEAIKQAKKSDKTTLADVGDHEIVLHFYNRYSDVFSPNNGKLSYFYNKFTKEHLTYIWGEMKDKELIKQIHKTLAACGDTKSNNYKFFVIGKSTENYMPKDLRNVINVHKFAKSKKMYTVIHNIQESYHVSHYNTEIHSDFACVEPHIASHLSYVKSKFKPLELARHRLPGAIKEKLRTENYSMSWAKQHDETVKGFYIKYPLLKHISYNSVPTYSDAGKELQEYIESKDKMNPRYYYIREQQKQLKISENDKNTVQP